MAGRQRKKPAENYFDYSLLFIVLFLVGFGLVMIYSTSSYEAVLQGHESTFYLKRQAMNTVIGLAAMIVVANIPYHFWEQFAMIAYIGSAILIVLVLVPQLQYSANGATRWIKVGPLTLQPAEVAKLGMILFLASLVCRMGRAIRTSKGFFLVMLIPMPICLMIWQITNNMSSAIIIFGIAVLMLFVASPEYKKFIILAAGGAAAVALLIFFISQASTTEGMGFRSERILAWLDPEAYASGKGFQTLQALYAIGSGGILGKGLGQSMQKLGFLPEAQNDMIFSIICEELGLFGAISVILMFLLLIWRFMVIANNASDLFGALLVVGVMGHIAIQVILNIAVVTNTIPNTGISLPFISYGGSAVLFLLIEVGIVLSVAKGIRLKDL